jgi:hypothetical protein
VAVIFPRWTNILPTAVAVIVPIVGTVLVGAVWYWFSPWFTDVGYQPEQPVAFSHRLHAGEMGMDCRYCHNTVERAAHAAVPPAGTCMNCHKVIKTESPKLSLIRESYETGAAVDWVRVHMLPDYAYFNHSPHLAAGVGCNTCHGRIDQMDVVTQTQPLSMSWCLDCHRNPAENLRPVEEVTNMSWDTATAGYTRATDENGHPMDASGTRTLNPPDNCGGCHR